MASIPIHDLEKIRIRHLEGVFQPSLQTCTFFLVLKGSFSFKLGEAWFQCNINDFFLVSPGETLSVSKPGDNLVLVLELDASMLENQIDHFDLIQCNSMVYPFHPYDPLIRTMAEIAKGSLGESTRDIHLRESAIYRFLYLLPNYIPADAARDQDNSPETRNKKRLYEIIRYIQANASKSITMAELANEFHLTPQYFSKFFKQSFQMNFVDYLKEVRLERAIQELTQSDLSITQIAYNAGFPNLTAFNQAFRAKFQETPTQFRQHQAKTKELPVDQGKERLSELVPGDAVYVRQQIDQLVQLPLASESVTDMVFNESLDIDCSQYTACENHCFDIINLGFAKNILSNEFQKQLLMAQKDFNFKYARFQNIFDPEIIDWMGKTGSFNFTKANRIIDFLYSIQMLPFFELGIKPHKVNITSDEFLFYTDNQVLVESLDEWELFLEKFLINCINRYGQAEVECWRFELWLPHSPVLEYTEDRIADFVEHYASLRKVFKHLLPQSQVGGFGFNLTASLSTLQDVMKKLEAKHLDLDFLSLISFHLTLVEQGSNEYPHFTTDSDYMSKRAQQARKVLGKSKIPLLLTEWNFDYTSRDYVNDTTFKALFIIKNLLENAYSYASVGYWLLSDLSSEYKDTNRMLFGGNGLLTVDSIKKPAYFAYQFLSRLGKYLVARGSGYIITRDDQNSYQILLYHYVHPSDFFCYKTDTAISIQDANNIFDPAPARKYSLLLQQVSAGNYRIKTYCLNQEHGSILDEWMKMGSINNVTPSEIDYFTSITIPSQNIYYQTCSSTLSITDQVRPNEIHLISIRLEI